MNQEMFNNILSFIPTVVLFLGGVLFIRFKNITWNNLLYLFFKNEKERINIITGKLWIISGVVLILINILFNPTVNIMVILNLEMIIVDYILLFIILKLKNRRDKL